MGPQRRARGGVCAATLQLAPLLGTLTLSIAGLLLWLINAGPATAALVDAAAASGLTGAGQLEVLDGARRAAHTAGLAVLAATVAAAGVALLARIGWRLATNSGERRGDASAALFVRL